MKIDYVDSDDHNRPVGFLITFRCYGTWLHGDERGSIDRRKYNIYGTPDMPANIKLIENEKAELKNPSIILNRAKRAVVERAIREVCRHRGYLLRAVKVR